MPGFDSRAKTIRAPSGRRPPKWRKGWDSNPRCGSPHTAFPVLPVKPLLHLSEKARMKDEGGGMKVRGKSSSSISAFSLHPSPLVFPGGEGGIRTHGGRKPTPVFETGALIHYATSPRFVIQTLVCHLNQLTDRSLCCLFWL